MLLGIYRGLQVILALLAAFVVYQSTVFFYYSFRDHLRGKNGVTQGLMVLYGGLILARSVTVAEAVFNALYVETTK